MSDNDDDKIEIMRGAYVLDLSEENPITPPPTHNAALFFGFAAYLAWLAHTETSSLGLWIGAAVVLLFALDESRRALRRGR